MRKSGPLCGNSSTLASRDHIAWCAEGATGFARLASEVVAAAPDDEQVLVVGSLNIPEWDPAEHFADEIESGRLRLADVDDAYEALLDGEPGYRRRQLGEFSAVLDDARTAGYAGLRVVADNTTMLTGSDELVERWLDWEQFTDRWQADQPVVGVCYFDRDKVPAERLTRVPGLHPLDRGFDSPEVRMYHDNSDGAVTLVLDGAIEWFDQNEFRGRLRSEAIAVAESTDTTLDIDLAGVDYMHHSALITINDTASLFDAESGPNEMHLQLQNAPSIVSRLHELMPDLDRVVFDN